jgi:L-ascorbate metabolism protein UlaG (beta-lactamase superfamily)
LKPEITFVGHASFVIRSGPTVIWVDPWLTSKPFNESWALHPEPVAPDLTSLTHLWISHEHPDHLNIPTLHAIPEDVRARLTVLYQQHYSSDVSDFLRSLGFADVIELVHGTRRTIGDFDVLCHQVGHEDAAMTFVSGGTTVLNLNDCKPTPRGLKRILSDTGPVDVLLDQFSVAGWTGNPDDDNRKATEAADTLAVMMMHIELIKPLWFVPTASFVRFCHEENAHMNSHVNTVDDVVSVVTETPIVVLYPGDVWDTATRFIGTEVASARYRADSAAVSQLDLVSHNPVAPSAVLAAAVERVADIRSRFPKWVLKRIPALCFAFTDQTGVVRVDVGRGQPTLVDRSDTACTIRLGSQAALYTFSHRWAIPTLLISGRFTIEGNESDWSRFKQLGAAYASGFHGKGAIAGLRFARKRGFFFRRIPDVIGQFLPKAIRRGGAT